MGLAVKLTLQKLMVCLLLQGALQACSEVPGIAEDGTPTADKKKNKSSDQTSRTASDSSQAGIAGEVFCNCHDLVQDDERGNFKNVAGVAADSASKCIYTETNATSSQGRLII